MNKSANTRRGATMVLVVVLLPIVFALAGIAVNFAYIQVVNTKMQIVTDAAVRAAGRNYAETGDEGMALAAAQQMASLNSLDNIAIEIQAGDLEFGVSQRTGENQKYTFQSGVPNGNSVRLTTNSLASGAGNAPEPFFPIFGSNFEIRPTLTATNTQAMLDIALIVDRSGSMRWPAQTGVAEIPGDTPESVPKNARWLDLVASVNIFFNVLEAATAIEQVSLSSYANSSSSDVPLSTDFQPVRDAMRAFSESFPGGSTNIHDGIMTGMNSLQDPAFRRPWATPVMLLMSDGNATSGDDPMNAATVVAEQGIPVYTISFSDGADQALMQQIADLTGGHHYHAETAEQLSDAFEAIAHAIPSLLTQ